MLRFRSSWIAPLLALLPAAGLAAAVSWPGDYGGGTASGDDPAPAITALLHGHLAAAAHDQPIIGLTSILLRMPFVAMARGVSHDPMLDYRLGVLACGWVAGLVAFAVARRTSRRSPVCAAVIAALMVINPLTIGTHLDGHPEELLGGALCVAGVLAAIDERPVLAGAALGLALGTKQWAVVALVPALIACGRGRKRLLVAAVAVAVPLVLALPLLDPSAFGRAWGNVGQLRFTYFRSWWWPFSATHTVHVPGDPVSATDHLLPSGLTRAQVSWLAPVVALPVGWRFWRLSGSRARRHDALGVLALLLLLRCTLDPAFSSYYTVPFLFALLAWETLTRPGLPLGSALTMAGFAFSERLTAPATASVCELVLTVGLTLYLIAGTLRGQKAIASAQVPGSYAPLASATADGTFAGDARRRS